MSHTVTLKPRTEVINCYKNCFSYIPFSALARTCIAIACASALNAMTFASPSAYIIIMKRKMT